MKKIVLLEFSNLKEHVEIKLDDSLSPNTVRAIIGNLPIEVAITRLGNGLYTEETPVRYMNRTQGRS